MQTQLTAPTLDSIPLPAGSILLKKQEYERLMHLEKELADCMLILKAITAAPAGRTKKTQNPVSTKRDSIRTRVLTALDPVRYVCSRELVQRTGLPVNLISTCLTQLLGAKMVARVRTCDFNGPRPDTPVYHWKKLKAPPRPMPHQQRMVLEFLEMHPGRKFYAWQVAQKLRRPCSIVKCALRGLEIKNKVKRCGGSPTCVPCCLGRPAHMWILA